MKTTNFNRARFITALTLACVTAWLILSTAALTLAQTNQANGRIAFLSRRDGNFEIYSMNPDGSDPTRLTNHPAFDLDPAYSPDGTRIAFTSTNRQNDFTQIYVMNHDGSNVVRLTSPSTTPADRNGCCNRAPAWSPDGAKIAFVGAAAGLGGSAADEIVVMNADGSNQVRLTNNASSDDNPAWSPDGTRIAFESRRDGDFEIYVMNSDGTNQTRLTASFGDDALPAWQAVQPPTVLIEGFVTRPNNTPIVGAIVTLSGSAQGTIQTGNDGHYRFTVASGGSYQVTVAARGLRFTPANQSFGTLTANGTANFTGTPKRRTFRPRN